MHFFVIDRSYELDASGFPAWWLPGFVASDLDEAAAVRRTTARLPGIRLSVVRLSAFGGVPTFKQICFGGKISLMFINVH